MQVSAGNQGDDKLPDMPEGLHADDKAPKTFTAMLAGLLDQVNKTLDEKKPDDRYKAMLAEIEDHSEQIRTLIKDTSEELTKLEAEEKKKITSESIHTGFDSSHVNKSKPSASESTKAELLNPNYDFSGGEARSRDTSTHTTEDEDPEASAEGIAFSKIATSNYSASLDFLGKHPSVLTEKETDGLLVLAFDAALERNDDRSRQCVHQALLLQYCRALGKDGVAMFFKRITSKGHQAQDIFYRDVQDTFMRIKNRAAEIVAERAKEGDGVEQIQLHAVEPGTKIQIRVPLKESDSEEEQYAREIFDKFTPEMREALESGELDKVNKVLGDMKVDEAEELIALFGEANILSLEEELIDATTEAGQQKLKDMEEAAKAEKAEEAGPVGDPE